LRFPLAASSAALLAAACATSTPPASTAPAPIEVKATGTPGQAAATESAQVTARVTAVDAATRSLTVKGDDGSAETFKVPPEVKRFDEIAVGDTIEVEVERGLLLEYQPVGSLSVEPQAVVAGAKAGAGEAPGGAVAGGVQATVTVSAIDMKTRVVEFVGPAGNRYKVKAGPKIQLEKLKVGDRLLATYVEAVAIQVVKAGKKP
jgi:hypothetical protein